MNDKQSFFRRSDFLIITAIVLLSLMAWAGFMIFSKHDHLKAQIYVNNALVKTIDLTTAQNGEFAVESKSDVIFEIKDGSIRFKESSCPDKICIKSGFLNRSNQSAACLPNKVILKIVTNKTTDDPDIIIK